MSSKGTLRIYLLLPYFPSTFFLFSMKPQTSSSDSSWVISFLGSRRISSYICFAFFLSYSSVTKIISYLAIQLQKAINMACCWKGIWLMSLDFSIFIYWKLACTVLMVISIYSYISSEVLSILGKMWRDRARMNSNTILISPFFISFILFTLYFISFSPISNLMPVFFETASIFSSIIDFISSTVQGLKTMLVTSDVRMLSLGPYFQSASMVLEIPISIIFRFLCVKREKKSSLRYYLVLLKNNSTSSMYKMQGGVFLAFSRLLITLKVVSSLSSISCSSNYSARILWTSFFFLTTFELSAITLQAHFFKIKFVLKVLPAPGDPVIIIIFGTLVLSFPKKPSIFFSIVSISSSLNLNLVGINSPLNIFLAYVTLRQFDIM